MRFPKLHIATSVVNRILNIADGIPQTAAPGLPGREPPTIPSTEMQSAVLDAKLAQPASQELPGIDQAPDPGGTAGGKPLLATMLDPK